MNFQKIPSFRRKGGERLERNKKASVISSNNSSIISRSQSQSRSRSRSRGRGGVGSVVAGGGVLAQLAQMDDREVLQAVNEIRRKHQEVATSVAEETTTLYTRPSLSRSASSSSSSSSSTSSTSSSKDETNTNTWGGDDNGSSTPYTIEIQNENGSTDSMCDDGMVIISDKSHDDPPVVRPLLSSRRAKQQQQQNHRYNNNNYVYSSDLATSTTESMEHDDDDNELGIEQFYKSSDEREFNERRRSNNMKNKKKQGPASLSLSSSSSSNRSSTLQRSKSSSFRRFQQYLPSVDTRSNSDLSWSYLEEDTTKDPQSLSHRRSSFTGFCVDGFSCVGNSQKYSIMDTSPVHGKKIRSTKSSSNESRLNLIDEFLLQKIRSKESSLMDESATFEEPDEDTIDDTVSRKHTSSRLVEYNDKRSNSQRRNSMSKQQIMHKRSIERVTPANSGCRNVFEEFIERLAGLDEDDDEDTAEIGLRLVQSVSRSRKHTSETSVGTKNTFDTEEDDEDESKLTYDLNTVSGDGSTYYTYDDTATSNQYTMNTDYTHGDGDTYTTATTRSTGGDGDSYTRYTNNNDDPTYGTTTTTTTNKGDDDYTMSTNGGRYTATTYDYTADATATNNTEQHTATTGGDYTYSNYTAASAGGYSGTTMTRTTMTGTNTRTTMTGTTNTNTASLSSSTQGSTTLTRQLPSPAGTYQTHSPLHGEGEYDDVDRTISSTRSAVSSFSTTY